MLRWRLLLGVVLTAVLIGLGWLDYNSTVAGLWLAPVALLAAVLGTQETLRLVRSEGLRPAGVATYLGNVCILLVNWAPAWQKGRSLGDASAAMSACGGALLAFLAAALLLLVIELVRYEKPGAAAGSLAAGAFTLAYVGLLLSFAVQLRVQWGVGALLSLLLVVKMSDIGAYTVGRLIGRHKMSPRISPGKTLEGAAGALLFAVAAAWAAATWIMPALGPATARLAPQPTAGPGGVWGWLLFGLAVGLAGMIGDLAESLLKRSAGVKDSSTWLPGFGGALDLLDSVLLAAPVAWLFWYAGWVG